MDIRQFPDKERFMQLAVSCNVIPVCRELLADTLTPVSLLARLCESAQEPVFLFESIEGGERWGRYSFLGTSARRNIRVFQNHVEVIENGNTSRIPHHADPLAVLRSLMADYRPAGIAELPRFWGGMVGYFAYEMASFFEAIPNRLPENTPLAEFIVPDEILIFDNIRHSLMALKIVFLDEKDPPGAAFDQALQQLDRLLDTVGRCRPEAPHASKGAGTRLQSVMTDEDFRNSVVRAKEYIQAGDIIQAVISQPFVCEPAPDPLLLYRAQRFINPSPYLYFMRINDTVLVGSSPEAMVRLENGIATLRPIAGTRPRGKSEQEDRQFADELLKDEKERAEHLMLVDLGRNDLGRVAQTGTVQVTDLMFIERYSHVMHLVSNINSDLIQEKDAWDLLAATFPAGTLSGAPKVRAMEIIAELEAIPRGPYGGAIGYISFSGNMDMAIVIRTACIENNRVTVRAGAGIVADSDPEKERIETVNKAMALQKALEMCGNIQP